MDGKRTTAADIIDRAKRKKEEASKNNKVAFIMVVIGSVLLFLISWVLSK